VAGAPRVREPETGGAQAVVISPAMIDAHTPLLNPRAPRCRHRLPYQKNDREDLRSQRIAHLLVV
jgi:hypothetical protein